MFGLKLKSWMENHIVRPRKKGNKNKNSAATLGTGAGSSNSQDTSVSFTNKKHGPNVYSSYNGNDNMNGNPTIHTSYVHNGCSGVISSPIRRREVSPIQNHTHSRYGWQSPDHDTVTSPKSDNYLYVPPNHRLRSFNSSGPSSCKEESEEKSLPNIKVNCSSSSISSLSWSTGSKEPSMNSSNLPQPHFAQAENSLPSTAEIEPDMEQTTEDSSNLDQQYFEDPNFVHYEEITTILRHPENIVNNNFVDQERPKSEQLSTYRFGNQRFFERRSQDDSNPLYGRLLPSRLQPNGNNSLEALNGNPVKCSNSDYMSMYHNGNPVASIPNPHFNYPSQNLLRGGNNKFKTVTNQPHLRSNLNGFHGPSLSSPESAYSTGYSTDGTSPGANYNPPEYYINMRTGTHYFPKSINTLAVEAQRYKFGLNKIEEMSPLEPQPKTSFANALVSQGKASDSLEDGNTFANSLSIGCHSPVPMRNQPIILPTLKGFETNLAPSPRQRCRIRTNPWYSTTDTSSSGATVAMLGSTPSQSMISSMISSSSQSSSLASSSKTEGDSIEGKGRNEFRKQNVKPIYESSESSPSSSSTEKDDVKKNFTPRSFRKYEQNVLQQNLPSSPKQTSLSHYTEDRTNCDESLGSDEETTLNEMMGKFDESYVYEKETDILSDSDPTDCASDLDTGREAGDECDTDELLEIDFIDTASIQEVFDRKDSQKNLGSCYYYNSPLNDRKNTFEPRASVRSNKSCRNSKKYQESISNGNHAPNASQRRKKRFLKTRKKSSESKDRMVYPMDRSRESRSLGGTPVCLRRKNNADKDRYFKTSPLSNRSNSLVLSDAFESRSMTIGESEKALLKADLEADVKYRQLILEAESLLVSMRNSLQSLPRETPVSSPRRLNPLANKRVEMLKNSEPEVKRDPAKQQQLQQQQQMQDQDLALALNKRIEMLKLDGPSAPNSPKLCPRSPRKTHLTNFINQNVPTEALQRKASLSESRKAPQSPKLQLNGRDLENANYSPSKRRRPSTKFGKSGSTVDSDSENEYLSRKNSVKAQEDVTNHNVLPEIERIMLNDCRNANVMTTACPQSEPLKRKIYRGSSSFERIKKSIGFENDLQKPSKLSDKRYSHHDLNQQFLESKKQQLILHTLADLKRSLETQSIELNGLKVE